MVRDLSSFGLIVSNNFTSGLSGQKIHTSVYLRVSKKWPGSVRVSKNTGIAGQILGRILTRPSPALNSDGRALVFRASGGLEPSIFWTFRASGGLGYQHFGPGRALNLSNELRAGTELLQLRNIIIFFIIWEKPKLRFIKKRPKLA